MLDGLRFLHEHRFDGVVDVTVSSSTQQLPETHLSLLCRRTAASKQNETHFNPQRKTMPPAYLFAMMAYLLLLQVSRLTSKAGTICSMWWGSQMFTCSSSSTVFLTTPWRPRIPDTRILDNGPNLYCSGRSLEQEITAELNMENFETNKRRILQRSLMINLSGLKCLKHFMNH